MSVIDVVHKLTFIKVKYCVCSCLKKITSSHFFLKNEFKLKEIIIQIFSLKIFIGIKLVIKRRPSQCRFLISLMVNSSEINRSVCRLETQTYADVYGLLLRFFTADEFR